MKKPLRVAPLLQRKVETGAVGLEIESGISAIIGGGQPLAESTRSFFEPRFGSDFSNVRVPKDSYGGRLAEALQAKAFTVGNDIIFGAGQFTPETPCRKHLLAHELVHVVQQGRHQYAPQQTSGAARPLTLTCWTKRQPWKTSYRPTLQRDTLYSLLSLSNASRFRLPESRLQNR